MAQCCLSGVHAHCNTNTVLVLRQSLLPACGCNCMAQLPPPLLVSSPGRCPGCCHCCRRRLHCLYHRRNSKRWCFQFPPRHLEDRSDVPFIDSIHHWRPIRPRNGGPCCRRRRRRRLRLSSSPPSASSSVLSTWVACKVSCFGRRSPPTPLPLVRMLQNSNIAGRLNTGNLLKSDACVAIFSPLI